MNRWHPIQGVRLQAARRKLLPKPYQSSCSIIAPFFFLSLCLPGQVTALHQRFISTATCQKLSKGMKMKVLQQKVKGKTGHSSLACTTGAFTNTLKLWFRSVDNKGEYRWRVIPSCRKGLLLACLCKGRLTMLVSYSGSNGYLLALSKFLFNNSSIFLGNTTISRYNGYYIYLQRPCTARI